MLVFHGDYALTKPKSETGLNNMAFSGSMDTTFDSTLEQSKLTGHPKGLTILFFTEMWERFSYYGMRVLLMLYMTTSFAKGGMGFEVKKAAAIYGAYTGSVWLMSLPGGWFADNVLGVRNTVYLGGIIIALGHYCMAYPSIPTFYIGLVLIVFGTGLLKPNVSAIVGSLYSTNDTRRDAGFSIFYVGINIGAFIAPLITSYLSEKVNWHYGFGAAGVGMTLGLIQYRLGYKYLPNTSAPGTQQDSGKLLKAGIGILLFALIGSAIAYLYFFGPSYIQNNRMYIMMGAFALFVMWMFAFYLKPEEKKPVAAIVILFFFSVVFYTCFEQAGSSFNLFARDYTNRFIGGWEFPAGWFQSVNTGTVVILAPVFAYIWVKMGDKQPSTPMKFAIALLFVGLGAGVIALASSLIGVSGKVGVFWLIAVYVLHEVGEICLYPTAMSTTTKLAPERLSGLMMGTILLSISFGSFIGGELAGDYKSDSAASLISLFGKLAIGPIVAGVVLLALSPIIKRLMGKVR